MQPNRVAATPVVRGDGDRRVGRSDGPPGIGRHERLVAEPDDDAVRPAGGRGGDAESKRGHLPVGQRVVRHDDDRAAAATS